MEGNDYGKAIFVSLFTLQTKRFNALTCKLIYDREMRRCFNIM